MSSSVLCGRGRLLLSRAAGRQAFAALRVGRVQTLLCCKLRLALRPRITRRLRPEDRVA
ncbi:hypothetical protein PAMA_014460 [Pampus argenteus]